MNWEIILAAIGTIGGFESVKWLATRRQTMKMASAEADSKQNEAESGRQRKYEEIITFLQNQLQSSEKNYAEQTERLHDSMTHVIDLTRRIGELENKILSVRCDIYTCELRKPPLPWNQKDRYNKEDTDKVENQNEAVS